MRPLFDDGSGAIGTAGYRATTSWNCSTAPRGAPVLTVYGGKITTYRRLAEAALQRLLPSLGLDPRTSWTADEPLPGGDMPGADLPRFTRAFAAALAAAAGGAGRAAGAHSTARAWRASSERDASMEDLGRDFGGGPHGGGSRATWCDNEWARSAEDILLRRTRLGLAFPASAVHDLQDAVTQLLR